MLVKSRPFAAVLLAFLTLPSPAFAATLRHAQLPAACHTQVEFLGFSRNEETLAMRTAASCPRADQSIDVLQVVELVRTRTGELLATYQPAPIWNTAGGRRTLLSHAEVAKLYPPLRQALGAGPWEQVRKLAQFKSRHHDFVDASVRLRLRRGTALATHVRLHTERKSLLLDPQPAGPLHVTVCGRLADGAHVAFASFERAGKGRVPAALDVYYAEPGHFILSVWHEGDDTQIALYATPPEVRFGTNEAGLVNVLNGTADEVETLYKAMHPSSAKAWDDNVGTLF